MIKVIATDLDGTFVDRNGQMIEEQIELMHKIRELGIQVVLCSGRQYEELSEIFDMCNLRFESICSNGSDVRDIDGHSVMTRFVPKEVIAKCFELSEKLHTGCAFHCLEKTVHVESLDSFRNQYIHYMKAYEPERYVPKAPVFFEIYHDFDYSKEQILNMDVAKCEFLFNSKEVQEELLNSFDPNLVNVTTASNYFNVEINHADCSKGKILKLYCESRNIDLKDVWVFGDGMNDLSMFAQFENSVAVNNAATKIKELAKIVTNSERADGFVEGLTKILEIEGINL